METKTLALEGAQFKFDDEGRKFSGYASVFNGVDRYGDTIVPGAYLKTIGKRERPIQLRWNHHGDVIGKWTTIAEDEKGLFVEGELTPGHSKASDVYALLKHGAVTGLSIGYRPVKTEDHGDGKRSLKEIELIEISIVETPADNAAHIGDVKSAIEHIESPKDAEEILRANGFTRSEACALVSRIKTLAHGDRESENLTAVIAGAFQTFQIPQP